MITTNAIFKQSKGNTCGITVCRAIIYSIKGECMTEEDILGKVQELDFTDNAWKSSFLEDVGPMPTERLRELLSKGFGIESEIKKNVPTKDIKQKEVLAVWEYTERKWHAVLIGDIKDGKVFYMNPQSGQAEHKSLEDFDELRRPKGVDDDRKFLEILCPICHI